MLNPCLGYRNNQTTVSIKGLSPVWCVCCWFFRYVWLSYFRESVDCINVIYFVNTKGRCVFDGVWRRYIIRMLSFISLWSLALDSVQQPYNEINSVSHCLSLWGPSLPKMCVFDGQRSRIFDHQVETTACIETNWGRCL